MQTAATFLGGDRTALQSLKSNKSSTQIRANAAPMKVIAGFVPPPAWPGRVIVPQTLPQRSGPKVRFRVHYRHTMEMTSHHFPS